jgi:hypothetical protein
VEWDASRRTWRHVSTTLSALTYRHRTLLFALARRYLDEQKIENVSLQRLSNLSELESITGIDVFYSTFVLQHNPPPVMHAMLDEILPNLNPGAFAFFQVPVYGDGYSFTIDDYMAGLGDVGRHGIEMHVLPQGYLFSLFGKARDATVGLDR